MNWFESTLDRVLAEAIHRKLRIGYKDIAGDHADIMILDREGANMYTIVKDGIPLGVVGFFVHDGKPFTEVAIDPEFRGKGLMDEFYQLLARKHGFDKLWAFINMNNKASVRAHGKMGFDIVDKQHNKLICSKDM